MKLIIKSSLYDIIPGALLNTSPWVSPWQHDDNKRRGPNVFIISSKVMIDQRVVVDLLADSHIYSGEVIDTGHRRYFIERHSDDII